MDAFAFVRIQLDNLEETCMGTREIERVVSLLKSSKSLLFITGAGISVASGLPTYRGIGGLYEDKGTEEGFSIESALSGFMFQIRPEITWRYLLQMESACRGASHNRAHEIVAEMERHFPRVWTLTQNVDGFHRRAGSSNVIEIHGDLHEIRCLECSYRENVPDYAGFESIPPKCPKCGDLIRPDVVLFGEMLSMQKVELLEAQLKEGFDMIFSIGTSSLFPYISVPVHQARKAGVPTVEIDPGETEISKIVDVKIASGAVEALEEIWRAYRA